MTHPSNYNTNVKIKISPSHFIPFFVEVEKAEKNFLLICSALWTSTEKGYEMRNGLIFFITFVFRVVCRMIDATGPEKSIL